MKLTFKNSKFAIYDDVLPPDMFDMVWLHAQHDNYSTSLAVGNWIKVWRIGDNPPLGTTEYHWSKRPFNNYMDVVGHYFNEIAKNTTDVVGDESNWGDLALRTYIYPRGSKLSWHNDADHYAGAFTYYVHPKWGSTWGGELMVAEVPDLKSVKKQPKVGPHLDHEWEDGYLLEYGVGQWISPKPNRCVVMASGVYHSISRVDADAGDHARVGIVGFLLKPKNSQLKVSNDEGSDLEIRTLEIGGI